MKDKPTWQKEAQAHRNTALYYGHLSNCCPIRQKAKNLSLAAHYKRLASICVKMEMAAT